MKHTSLLGWFRRLCEAPVEAMAFADLEARRLWRCLHFWLVEGSRHVSAKRPRWQLTLEPLEKRVVMTTYRNLTTINGLSGIYYPNGIAYANGTAWITEGGYSVGDDNKIAKISGGSTTPYSITGPTPTVAYYSEPNAITVGPDGNLWFTELNAGTSGAVGTISPSAPANVPIASQFAVPATGVLAGHLGKIIAGPDGNLWIGSTDNVDIQELTTAGVYTTIYDLTSEGGYGDFAAGPDGKVWFTNNSYVGNIDPSSGMITTYPFAHDGSYGYSITTDSKGNLWFGGGDGYVGWVTPAGFGYQYQVVPSVDTIEPTVMVADGSGDVWFRTADSEGNYPNMFGEIAPDGAVSVFPQVMEGDDRHFRWQYYGFTQGGGNVWYLDDDASGTPTYYVGSFPEAYGAVDSQPAQGPVPLAGTAGGLSPTSGAGTNAPAYTSLSGSNAAFSLANGNLTDSSAPIVIDDSVDPTALVYNSDTVGPRPIVEVLQGTAGGIGSSLTGTVTTTLVFDSPARVSSFSTTGHSAGDTYLLAAQANDFGSTPDVGVDGTGLLSWDMDINMTRSILSAQVENHFYSRTAAVDLNGSAYGDGWSLAGVDSLLTVNGGLLYVYGQGGTTFFAGPGSDGSYRTLDGTPGTITADGGEFVYTGKDQDKRYFDSIGGYTFLESAIVDPAGPITTFVYSSGLLIEIDTPAGNAAEFNYDVSNHLSSIDLPGGRVVTVTVDGNNNLTNIALPDGSLRTFSYLTASGNKHLLANDQYGASSITFSYDSATKLLTGIDQGNNVRTTLTSQAGVALTTTIAGNASASVYTYPATYVLDSSGEVASITTADGGTQTLAHNSAGQVTVDTDGKGNTTSFTYDSPGGNVLEETTPTGTTSYLYDAFNNVTQMTDPLGHVTQYSYYTTSHLLKTTTDALGDVTTDLYDAKGNLTEVIDPLSHTTKYSYDGANRKQTMTDALGDVTSYMYDAAGMVTLVIDPLGNRTSTLYDKMERVTSVAQPGGITTTYAYNSLGLVSGMTDPMGHQTTYSYTNQSWLSATTRAAGTSVAQTTTNLYDVNGNVTGTQDPMGNLTQYLYDNTGRQTETIDALSFITTSLFDKAGNVTETIDAAGNATTYAYDANNRQTGSTSAIGGITTTLYDQAGNVTETIDANGKVATFAYDALNRQIAAFDAVGGITTTFYDKAGNVTGTQDANGHLTTYLYDAANRQTGTLDALSFGTSTIYDKAGNVTETVDANGHATTFAYDTLNRQIAAFNALNGITTTLYDKAGNVTGTQDANGNLTSYLYDALNRQTEVIDALSFASSTVYDKAGNVTESFDAKGHLTSFAYDALNRQTNSTNALGGVTTTLYDKVGNVTEMIDANGHATTFAYDAMNRLSVTFDALNHRSTTLYDKVGNVTEIIDANGHVTTFSYDGDNRRTTGTDALGDRVTTLYDKVGNVTETIDANSYGTYYSYDAINRLTTTTDAMSEVTKTYYDKVGNVTETIDPSGIVTTFAYDALNRLTLTTDGAGDATSMVYDKVGNVTESFDGSGNPTTFSFDADNRQTVVTDALGHMTTTLYDKVGNVTFVKDADNNVTTYAYDALNRMTLMTDPLNHASSFAYDAVGNMTMSVDRDGRLTVFQYDALNRVTGQTMYSDNSGLATHITDLLTATYDAAGNQLTAADGAGTYTMMYDAVNRVTGVTDFGQNLTFTYDPAGNRTQVQYDGGGDSFVTPPTIETSTYDAVNRLTERQTVVNDDFATFFGALKVNFTYQANGQLQTMTRYGVFDSLPVNLGELQFAGSTTILYDAANRVSSIAHYDGHGTVQGQYTYGYDTGSRLTSETDDGAAVNYAYDKTNQLTKDGTTTYQYDATGNRTTVIYGGGSPGTYSYATTTGNEMTSDGVYTYTYDNEGNIKEKATIGGGAAWTYTYDNHNHMTAAREYSSVSLATLTQEIDYKYDFFGNMTEEIVVGSSTNDYFYDGWNPALAKGQGASRFVAWGEVIGGVLTQYLHGDGVDQLLGQISNGATGLAWLLQNRQDSNTAKTDGYGNLLFTVTYDAFGNVASSTSISGDPQPEYTWEGQRLDGATGLYQIGARAYDPTTGRWTSQDPLGFDAGDSNLYRYVNNGPTDAWDPSGLQAEVVRGTLQGSVQIRSDGVVGTLRVYTDSKFEGETGVYMVLDHEAIDAAGVGKGQALEPNRGMPMSRARFLQVVYPELKLTTSHTAVSARSGKTVHVFNTYILDGDFPASNGLNFTNNHRDLDYLPSKMQNPPYFSNQIFDQVTIPVGELRRRNRELDSLVKNSGRNADGSAIFTAYFTDYLESVNTGKVVGRVQWQVSAHWEYGKLWNSISSTYYRVTYVGTAPGPNVEEDLNLVDKLQKKN